MSASTRKAITTSLFVPHLKRPAQARAAFFVLTASVPCGARVSKSLVMSREVGYQNRLSQWEEEKKYGEVIPLPGVILDDSDNFDVALRRFKKQIEKAGVLSELKKRQHYEKPSVQRKKKKAAARKRLLKKMRKMSMS